MNAWTQRGQGAGPAPFTASAHRASARRPARKNRKGWITNTHKAFTVSRLKHPGRDVSSPDAPDGQPEPLRVSPSTPAPSPSGPPARLTGA